MQWLSSRTASTFCLHKARFPVAFSLYNYAACLGFSTSVFQDVGQPSPMTHPQLLKEGDITSGITSNEYISRRERLIELLPEKSLAIIASAPVKMMTDVVPYPFRQDANYSYITGCLQPGGVAVLSVDYGFCMFMPDNSPQDIVWQGKVAGVDEASTFFKAERVFPLRKMHEILPDMIRRSSNLYHNLETALPTYMELEAFRKASLSNKVKDISLYTDELRWIKSSSEIKLMKQSASIACQSLLQTIIFSTLHPEESKLAARVEYECKMRGAQRMAFNPVVGGGVNGSVIHYSRNDQKIKDGDLVLMDVGCEINGYLSDLTRTWPPCGYFSSSQEVLYNLILETSKECIKLCKPGISIQEIHNFSVKMLQKGLVENGILKNNLSMNSYHKLNPTSIGHYLGMDIHDSSTVSNYLPLQPGV
ncbi:putative Xaa-pro dipeptidase, partial [Zostera marina]